MLVLKSSSVWVNHVPGIVPHWSELSIIATSNGISYEEFLEQIIDSALKTAEKTYPQDTKSANNVKAAMPGMTSQGRWISYNLRTWSDLVALLECRNAIIFGEGILEAMFLQQADWLKTDTRESCSTE